MGSKHILLEEPSWQQLSDLCIVCGFEEENSLVNLLFFCVLLCLIKKRSLLTFYVFLIFLQNAGSQLCFRFF